MSYHLQSWAARSGALGDESEGVFQAIYPNAEPYGFNHTKIPLRIVPAFVRYTPDFRMHNRLAECMGIGRDGTLKLKIEKLDALCQWARQFHTDLFIWDSAAKRHIELPIMEVRRVCEAEAVMQRFPEGKPAWFLHTPSMFSWGWVAHAAAAA